MQTKPLTGWLNSEVSRIVRFYSHTLEVLHSYTASNSWATLHRADFGSWKELGVQARPSQISAHVKLDTSEPLPSFNIEKRFQGSGRQKEPLSGGVEVGHPDSGYLKTVVRGADTWHSCWETMTAASASTPSVLASSVSSEPTICSYSPQNVLPHDKFFSVLGFDLCRRAWWNISHWWACILPPPFMNGYSGMPGPSEDIQPNQRYKKHTFLLT